jgi:hypothetical protein
MPAPSARVVLALVVSSVVAAAGFFLPLPAAVATVAVGVFLAQCAGWWWLAAQGGPHIVYLLRNRAGWVLYVGTVKERKNGPATLRERLEEHEDSIDQYPWKSAIYWPNCTVARRCLTRWGTTWSEKRRIHSLAFAARWRMCPALRNVQHNTKPRTAIVGLAWYRLESALWPSGRWHKPLVAEVDGDAAEPEPEPAERRPVFVPDDDELGFFEATASQLRARAAHPSADDSDLTDDEVDATFAALTSGWGAGDDVASTDVPLVDTDVSAGEVGPLDVVHGGPVELVEADNGQPADTSGVADGDGDASCDGRETPENGASGLSDGLGVTSGPDGGRKRSGGRPAKRKVCVEQGCDIEAVRYSRCADHARAWDRERKRRKRQGGDQ